MATTARTFLSKYALPGWVLIIVSQLERLYNLVDAWSNLEFISEKVRDTWLLPFVADLFAWGLFQVILIVTGLIWIALASSPTGECRDLRRFWPLRRRAVVETGEDVVYLIRRSIGDQLADRKHERKAEKFPLVQDDRSVREYTLQEVDKLTPTQRERLFTADPEMAAWWMGKSPASGAWPLFRGKGGIWIAKDLIDQTPREHHSAIWEIPGLLDWYLQGREF